jgi:hypothetical protein
MILYDTTTEMRYSGARSFEFRCEKYHVDDYYDLELWFIDGIFRAYQITPLPGVEPVTPPALEVEDFITQLKKRAIESLKKQ